MSLINRRLWMAAAAAACLPAGAAARTTAPAVMHGREAPEGLDPAPYLVSEKYDGVRAVWDGQALRFRSGLPVAAPAWFTAALPRLPLDGELWLARGRFEALSGTVRRAQPLDADWRAVRYMVFDLPGGSGPFEARARRLHALLQGTGLPWLQAVVQQRLPDAPALQQRLQSVLGGGGEGLMLHRADAVWAPGRSDALLKLKPLHDAEAEVVGHQAGRGRHAGRLGALRVRGEDGTLFEIGTGFSDAERARPPAIGSTVTYTHRGVTAGGVPRHASFLRVRDGV